MPGKEKKQQGNRVIDLKAGAHVMQLNTGVFCVFHAPGQEAPGPSGLPGARISRAPGVAADAVDITTFEADGWMGGTNGAALIRVKKGPAGVMVTTYQELGSQVEGPRLQVICLSDGVQDAVQASNEEGFKASRSSKSNESGRAASSSAVETGSASVSGAVSVSKTAAHEVLAHIQGYGDVGGSLGEWVGTVGSAKWVEGFSIQPDEELQAGDIEYQAVLGKGWLSPWVEGGQFCGSKGMALPILGLRVRLKGEAAQKWSLRLTATFVDGTMLEFRDDEDDALEAESLAPLEAFRLEVVSPSVAGKSKKENVKPSLRKKSAAQKVAASGGGRRNRS